ncbi:MAG: hypothetical protein RL711_76 [Bacteroidota bacterium]|jgi:uncharacterized membrane protein
MTRKNIGATLLKYFLQGLLLTAPLAFTVSLTVSTIRWFDGLLNITIPGLGILIIMISITSLGYLASTIIIQPLFNFIDLTITKTPFLGIIYTSIKDLFNAFVGNDKKFNKPVLVKLNAELGIEKIGFITQTDLSSLGITAKIAVYLPHSYNFSGELIIVPVENVTPINKSSAEVMKFIISGGVSEFK